MKTMKAQRAFKFRIVEEVSHYLLSDNKTIESHTKYHLYLHEPGFFRSKWIPMRRIFRYDFDSLDDARARAYEYADECIKSLTRKNALKDHQEELKPSVTIISEFEVPA